MIAHNSQALDTVNDRVKQCIYAFYMHENDLVMTCNRAKPSITNTLKKNHLGATIFNETIFNEFSSTYYVINNGGFELFFKQYTEISVINIDHLILIR